MAKSGRAFVREIYLRQWREALPGVKDEEIVLPCYHAKPYGFPPPSLLPENQLIWRQIRWELWLMIRLVCDMPVYCKGRRPPVHRLAQNAFRRALRWWHSLENIAPLR